MTTTPTADIYFLIFASIVLFAAFIFFIIFFFNHYRKKERKNYEEKEALRTAFQHELLQSKIEMQEQTFSYISQEIHDNVGQVLSLAKVQVNIMQEGASFHPAMLEEVKSNIGKALTDLRGIAKRLSSERIRELSILDAVGIELEQINKTGIIQANLVTEGEERKMDEQKKQILFRIVQECLQNIIKHAEASQINVVFCYSPGQLNVCIRDNGKGFDVEQASRNRHGLGLQNIKTRTSLIGGEIFIESMLNTGTVFNIKFPHE